MSENEKKYIFNSESGRYILKGGSLHRRLIRLGKMEPIELSKRTPMRQKDIKPKVTSKKTIKKPLRKTDNDNLFEHLTNKLKSNDNEFKSEFLSFLKEFK